MVVPAEMPRSEKRMRMPTSSSVPAPVVPEAVPERLSPLVKVERR